MKKIPMKRRVLIVGEGRETEYNYFVGFREKFRDELAAMAISVRVARGKGGSARGIVEKAIYEKKKFEPDPRHGDRVFLLMDTEGPGRAPELPDAGILAAKNKIEVIYSSPAFEYWLLCHFEKISRSYFKDCASVMVELDKRWKRVSKSNYDKSDQDIFSRLSVQFQDARKQALEIDLHHLTTAQISSDFNPSSQVYELIGILLGARTGEKCPIHGDWMLSDNPSVKKTLNKGDDMPNYENNETHWRL